jgi:hypothetical protein
MRRTSSGRVAAPLESSSLSGAIHAARIRPIGPEKDDARA